MNDRLGLQQLRWLFGVGAAALVFAVSLNLGASRHEPAGPSREAMHPGRPAPTFSAPLSTTIVAVERGAHDVITITSGGRAMRVVADRARIVVPVGAAHVVGSVSDLGPGQHAAIVLEPGSRLADGARAASITVGTVGDNVSTG